MVKSPYIGDGHPTFKRNDHPLLYGNNGSLDPGTYIIHTPLQKCEIFRLNVCFFLRMFFSSPMPPVVFFTELHQLCSPTSPTCGEGRGESDDLDCCWLRYACELGYIELILTLCPTKCMGNVCEWIWMFGIHSIFRMCFGKSSLGKMQIKNQTTQN